MDGNPHTPEPASEPHRMRGLTVIAVCSVLVGLASGLIAAWALTHDPPQNVLEYELQRIEYVDARGNVQVPRVPGVEGPAVCVGDAVPVRSTLTITADGPIELRGNRFWSTTPPGFDVQTAEGRPVLYQGPTTVPLEFDNRPMPDGVEHFVLSSAEPVTYWQIRGTVTPTSPKYASVSWTTQRFAIVDCERWDDG